MAGLVINTRTKPVVALDIDGTSADYHGWFLRFAEMYLGRDMPAAEQNNPGMPLHAFMGVSKATYRKVKLAYRQGGLKRAMPVTPGMPDAVRSWRKAGAEVWICTTRPYLRLDSIDPDTREWLRRNRMQYDAVLFGHNKYRELKSLVGVQRVVAVIEDLPEMMRQAEECGLTERLLRDQPYNRYWPEAPHGAARWYDAGILGRDVLGLIREWKKGQR